MQADQIGLLSLGLVTRSLQKLAIGLLLLFVLRVFQLKNIAENY